MKTYLKICVMILGVIALQSFMQQDGRQDFIRKAVQTNRFEIALAEQAINKSGNASVQELAKTLVDDHRKNLSELEAYAHANELDIPTGLDQEQQRKLESFSALEKDSYDRSFKEAVVGSHERSVALFEGVSSDDMIEDEELKKWAAEKLPTLRNHLDRSKSLSFEMSTMPRTMPPIGNSFKGKLDK